MKIHAKGDQVLIRLDKGEADGRGMLLTDAGVVHRAPKVWSGVVVAAGPGKKIPGSEARIPPEVEVGDHVQLEEDCGMEFDMGQYGAHLLVREKFIQFIY